MTSSQQRNSVGQDSSTSRQRSTAHRNTAHRNTVEIELTSIAEFLLENLGAGLVGLLAGVDPQTARRWARRSDRRPREDAERRLRAAYQVFQELLPHEAAATIRAWFMGMNPQLDDLSPAEALADDRTRDTLAAARAFISGG